MKQYRYFLYGAFLLCQAVCFSSCTRTPLETAPEITCFEVHNMESLSAMDTLWFSLCASHQSIITSVRLTFSDSNGSVLLSQSWNPETEVVLFEEAYFLLNRKDLPTADYTLRATVSSSGMAANTSLPVTINALELEVVNYFLISEKNANNVTAEILHDDLSVSDFAIFAGDFLDAAIDSDDNFMFLSGEKTGDMICYSLDDKETIWEKVCTPNPPFPCFTSMEYASDLIYIAEYNSYIYGFDRFGIEKYRAFPVGSMVPNELMLADDYLVATVYDPASGNDLLVSWYLASGVHHTTLDFGYEDLLLIGAEQNIVYFSCAQQGNVSIIKYDLLWDEKVPVAGVQRAFHCSCGGGGVYYLADEWGIYRFSAGSGLVALFEMSNVSFMTRDAVEESLWIISGNGLFKYRVEDDVIEKSNTFDFSPASLVIQYNRNRFLSD